MQKISVLLLIQFLLLYGTFAYAQKIAVQGKIVDSHGLELPGVNITIKGKGIGSITDVNGRFNINAEKGDILSFSYIGYEPSQVTIKDQHEIVQILRESSQAIKEVVVTALGIEKKESTIGYAISEVEGKDLVKARDPNPITGLAGKVAGLSVGASSEMLGTPNVLLRGDNLTLYVVDGVPISSDTWNISPDDIDSYSVLKGPAAAALYGSRAKNGAILITTKKGTKGKKGLSVEVNSSNMFDKGFLAFPRLQTEYGAGENEIYAFGDGKGGGLNDGDYDVWGPKFKGQLIPQWDGAYTPNQTWTTTFGDVTYKGHITPTPYVARNKNNLGSFLQTGFQTTDNISVTKSGDDYTIRTSMSHSYQKSIIPNMSLNITNFNVFASYNISKKFSIDANVNFNYQYTPNYPDVSYGPNSLIYNVGIWTGADWDVNDPTIKGIWQTGKTNTQSVFAEYQRYHNPWLMVKEWLRGHDKKDTYGYFTGHYIIDDHLNLSLRTQMSTYNLLRTEKMPFSAHPYGRESGLGDYREDHRNLMDNNTDLQLNYNYMLGDFVQLSGLAGGNIRIFNYNSSFTSTDYLVVPDVYSFSNSLNAVQSTSFSSRMNVYSAYASMDMDFGKYATVSATARVDKSSAIVSTNDTYFYPSVSVATLVSDYVKLPDFISSLKLRGSFAEVKSVPTSETIGTAPFNTITALGGSASTSIYGYPLDYGTNYLSPYGGPSYSMGNTYSISKLYNNETSASYTNTLYDSNIQPEVRVNYEEGIDISFLKNRLGLNATVFQYIDGPKILQNEISTTTGYEYNYINALKTRKTGVELSFKGIPVKTKNFSWDVLANWSTFKEVYAKLPSGQDTYNTFFKEGDRTDKLYGTAFYKTKDGQIIHDSSGKPLVMQVSQYLGNMNGDFQWSLSNRFSYKNAYVSFQFDGNVGGVMVDYLYTKTMRGGSNIETVQGAYGVARSLDDLHAGEKTWAGAYVGQGVVVSNGVAIKYDSKTGAITNYDALQFTPNTATTQVQDYVSKYYGVNEADLMSKTYIKLRELTVGFNFPEKWISPLKITKASLSFVARNLLYIYGESRFKDVDLDQYNGASSSTGLQTPTTRRYGVNFNVTF
jgi:TonB-linked SusC/RagA family outer membrane protein